jgi:7-cyano-7-deazaguanine synthase
VSVVKVSVLFSGGVESTCLLYYLLRKGYLVYPIYVKAGYPWESLELENALNLWKYIRRKKKGLMPLKVVRVIAAERVYMVNHSKDLFIPLRNLSLILSALSLCVQRGIYQVAVGSLGIYPFPDNNADYMKRLEGLLSLGTGRDVRILIPFMGLEKEEVVRVYGKGVPLHMTLSCVKPIRSKSKIIPCGECEKCKERESVIGLSP